MIFYQLPMLIILKSLGITNYKFYKIYTNFTDVRRLLLSSKLYHEYFKSNLLKITKKSYIAPVHTTSNNVVTEKLTGSFILFKGDCLSKNYFLYYNIIIN